MSRTTRGRGANGRESCASEDGFILLTVIFLMALLVLALSIAAPRMAKQIQRDREVETMERGKQYQRAVQLYYRKFGAYPPSIEALVKTNNIRFLRKRYLDPMTGKDDWKPIHWGQNKTPTAMGFFGQPLSGTTIGGVGPSGGNMANGNGLTGGSGIGGSSGSGIGGGSSLFDSSDTSSASAASTANGSGTTTGGTAGGTGAFGSTGSGIGGSSDGTGGSGTNSSTGLSGQTFGGAGVIGFSPGSPKESILVYKKKNHFNEWEFTYDPLQDQKMMQGGNTSNSGINGQPAASSSSSFGSGSGSGGSFGSGSGIGSGSSFGGGTGSGFGSTPPTTSQPQ